MIDEDIIASAKRIILKLSKKEENDELSSKSEDAHESKSKIDALINMIQQQDENLRRVEEKLNKLIANA